MERVSLQYISPTDSMDSEDSKLSKAEILRGLITEKLTTAAQEIFAVVERTVAGYEEEVSGLKQEVDRQKKQMEVVLQPHVSLCRIVCEDVEERAGGGQLTVEEQWQRKQRYLDAARSYKFSGHSDERGSEDKDDVASAEEPNKDKDDLRKSDHQLQNTRDQSVTPEIRMWNPLNLRVCLLRDTQANMVKESDVKQAAGSKEVSGHTEEQEEEKEEVASAEEPAQSTSVEQEGLRDPDYQIPKKRGQSVKTKFRTCDRFILRVCLLRNNQTNVLKKGVLKSQIKRMKCPRCMKEADFLTQLRSTFPKLNGEFDTFTSDATRKLTPLKLNTLTPVEIYNSIKSSGKGRSALYIRVKAADEKQISDKELHPAITGSLSTSVAASDETGQHKSICSRALERVEGKKADAVSSNPRKHQIETKDADDDHGVDLPVLPDPTSDSLVASPTHSAALSEANHGEAPENRQQDDSDWCMMESNTDSYSLVRHRKQSSRLSSLPSSASSEPNNEENASDSNMNEDHRDTDWKPEKGDESPSSKMKTKKQKSLQVRVCFLKDTQTDMLTKKAYKCPVRMLMCPRGLQQKEFLALLRSTFPEILKGNQPFDAFLTDNLRRLEPLKVKTLTAEEICKSIRSTGKGRSALCIRVKRNNKATSETPCTSTTPNYENMPHASSSNSPVEKAKQQQIKTDEVEEGEDCGISDSDDITVLSSAGYATENEDNSGGDEEVEEGESDVDWQSDKNDDEQQGESDPKLKSLKVKRKQGMKHSGVKTKRRKLIKSSQKAWTKGIVSCKVCGSLRGSMNILIKHSWSHVDNPKKLCGVCGKHSESAEELRNHLQSHLKTHTCNICGRFFICVAALNRHVKLHSGERPFKCEICHKTYISKSSLIAHRWKHVDDKPHKCDVCHQSFGQKKQLMVHNMVHTGEKPYCCNVCSKSFGNLRSLSLHKLRHNREKHYACQGCEKQFISLETLREHRKIHTVREKTYLCDICCKAFYKQGELNVHLKTHSTEKILCNECGKGLSSQSALKRHMIIHSGERPYSCSKCGRAFNSRSTLSGHMRTHSGEKRFVCGVCGKACPRLEHLKVHMRTHNGERPYQCTICDKAFTQSHCLKTHMKSHQRDEESAVRGLIP